MCLNCGCGRPADSHGKEVNLTLKDLQKMAIANNMSMLKSAHNIVDTLKGTIKPKDEDGS